MGRCMIYQNLLAICHSYKQYELLKIYKLILYKPLRTQKRIPRDLLVQKTNLVYYPTFVLILHRC